MIIKILILTALIRLLITTHKPMLCAIVYTVVVGLSYLVIGNALSVMTIGIALVFVFSLIYFWLLERFCDSGMTWWVIMLGGICLGFV
jgi:hypothetical protein